MAYESQLSLQKVKQLDVKKRVSALVFVDKRSLVLLPFRVKQNSLLERIFSASVVHEPKRQSLFRGIAANYSRLLLIFPTAQQDKKQIRLNQVGLTKPGLKTGDASSPKLFAH